MFIAAVKAAQVDKTDCVLIDDRAKNIARAMQFGLPSILFPAHADHYGAEYLRKLLKDEYFMTETISRIFAQRYESHNTHAITATIHLGRCLWMRTGTFY